MFRRHRALVVAAVLSLVAGAAAEHLRFARQAEHRELDVAFENFVLGAKSADEAAAGRVAPALAALQQCDQAAASLEIADAVRWLAAIQESERRERLWRDVRTKHGLPVY